jgi:phosphate starvation-inducible PhoH-like protein
MKIDQEQIELNEEVSRHLLGSREESGLKLIRSLADVSARARGNCLVLEGPSGKIELIKRFIGILGNRIEQAENLDAGEIKRLFDQFVADDATVQREFSINSPFAEIIASFNGRVIRPKTFRQQDYIDAIERNTVTIARGPAGTGKTYLATAMAIKALKEKKVSRVILSRPVVEAGESLGYLPGDIKEKVDPHFRPLYDSLQEFIGMGKFEQFLRQGIIEITPLAYMRGRTFNESFVVLDEAQNTTLPQMRMILTRLGYGSKMVVTGDHTQIDLPRRNDSSLLVLDKILAGVESVSFIELTGRDVIRHEIVRRIIEAFESFTDREKNKS